MNNVQSRPQNVTLTTFSKLFIFNTSLSCMYKTKLFDKTNCNIQHYEWLCRIVIKVLQVPNLIHWYAGPVSHYVYLDLSLYIFV